MTFQWPEVAKGEVTLEDLMSSGKPYRYIATDLDETLAYKYWSDDDGISYDPLKIGPPVPTMVKRIKAHLDAGDVVKVFTARVAREQYGGYQATDEELSQIKSVIADWTKEHLGVPLEATAIKDYGMVRFYDDRAVQIIPGTGLRADGRE